MPQNVNTGEALGFDDWRQWLKGDELLSPGSTHEACVVH
jgi:hypothetical protein